MKLNLGILITVTCEVDLEEETIDQKKVNRLLRKMENTVADKVSIWFAPINPVSVRCSISAQQTNQPAAK